MCPLYIFYAVSICAVSVGARASLLPGGGGRNKASKSLGGGVQTVWLFWL